VSIGVLSSGAATVQIFNAATGPATDTLFVNRDGSLMNSGLVAVGYFPIGITSTEIDTVPELLSQLGTFTVLQSAVPGTSLALPKPGYVTEDPVPIGGGAITGANALLGRMLYCIATDSATLATGSNFTLFEVQAIKDDVPFEYTYTANPTDSKILIGMIGSFTGDPGQGYGTYRTIGSFPEPSTAFLAAFGAFGLLRRRRQGWVS
jgi:hypothetical protein